ncbi:hypothetical protein COI_0524 [Mannheimia haemolytica serotype A2 str. OVINE]|nr:hypothetical protein COI_0524 [Mannheimia haemolytica serotype A2 str. OVINE]EEY13579.1 hypothetical protein COK_0232 [Mannheimia haemolytica serotype A2 str. BOVINE]
MLIDEQSQTVKVIGSGGFVYIHQLSRCSSSDTCYKQFNEFMLFVLT